MCSLATQHDASRDETDKHISVSTPTKDTRRSASTLHTTVCRSAHCCELLRKNCSKQGKRATVSQIAHAQILQYIALPSASREVLPRTHTPCTAQLLTAVRRSMALPVPSPTRPVRPQSAMVQSDSSQLLLWTIQMPKPRVLLRVQLCSDAAAPPSRNRAAPTCRLSSCSHTCCRWMLCSSKRVRLPENNAKQRQRGEMNEQCSTLCDYFTSYLARRTCIV
jgi:hypothetical protein